MLEKFLGFLREADGTPSNTRLSIFILIMAYIAWVFYILHKTPIVPGTPLQIPDMPWQVAALLAALYGVNKAPAVVGAIKNSTGKVQDEKAPKEKAQKERVSGGGE